VSKSHGNSDTTLEMVSSLKKFGIDTFLNGTPFENSVL
jgi:hypothetical protein